MRWPFGPPHLTLKPSKKNPKNKKTKKTTKKQERKEGKKETAKIPKNSFSIISQIFPFLVGFQNLPFLTSWPKKRASKKHYKNWVSSTFFLKSRCASRNGHFWNKKPKVINFNYHFFGPIFFSFNNKKPKIAETPVL